MARSNWKPLYIHQTLIDQQKQIKPNTDIILTNRSSEITKQMVGLKIQIYNGIRFFPLLISNDMIGQKLGEFAPTRKRHIPPKKKNQQK